MGSASPQGGPRKLGQEGCFSQSGAACEQAEVEAVRLANEMQAEYWSVSAKTGELPQCMQFPSVSLWDATVIASCAGDHAGPSVACEESPHL